jgi:hypothetical protein
MADRGWERAREEEDRERLTRGLVPEKINLSDINVRTPPLRHPPFGEPEKKIFERFAQTFAEVYPRTPEQWEDGFRRDMYPFTQIAVWEAVEATYLHFTEGHALDLERKANIMQAIMAVVMHNQKDLLENPPRTLSVKRCREIFNFAEAEWLKRK